MAWCPECKSEMSATDIVCPKCGFDFPNTTAAKSQGFWSRLAWSPLAEMGLLAGMIAAAIGCIYALVLAVVAFTRGELLVALVFAPALFFLNFGVLVVFLRIQDVRRDA